MGVCKRYRVINNITDKVMFEGTSKELSEITGASTSRICEAAKEGRTICRGKYRLEDISEDTEKENFDVGLKSAAQKWDEFCEPIRKKYGIPVYRPGKEVRR